MKVRLRRVNGMAWGYRPEVKRPPKAVYRRDLDGGPDADGMAWGYRPEVKRPPKAVYRRDLDGGPDADGMVLMTVLWIVLVISFISFALAAAVRVELNSTGNSFDSERAIVLAKGAAETVLQKLKDSKAFPQSPMREEQGSYIIKFDSGEVVVKVETDSSRIDLNGADEKVMGAMFASMGIDPATSDALVDSILDWRDTDDVARPNGAEINDYGSSPVGGKKLPGNAPFSDMQELMLVKHMTPEIYCGGVTFDPNTNRNQKTIGLRDVATVGSGSNLIDVNTAPFEVLAALPGLDRTVAASIVAEREKKPFADAKDLSGRVPDLNNSPAHGYLTTTAGVPNLLIARATVQPSGISRTVRLRLRTERGKKIITHDPLVYVDTPVAKFGAWEY